MLHFQNSVSPEAFISSKFNGPDKCEAAMQCSESHCQIL